jgi:hypothetical protein
LQLDWTLHVWGLHLRNKQTHLDKYTMPLPKEIFDVLAHAKVFNTLDLDFNYHQLSLKEGDNVKTTFWNINFHQKDFFRWQFLPFSF